MIDAKPRWPVPKDTLEGYLYRDQLKDVQIAAVLGRSETAVRRLRGKYGLPHAGDIARGRKADRKLKWPPTVQALKQFKAMGLGDRVIAARYGVSESMIRKRRQKLCIEAVNRYDFMKTKRPWPADRTELVRLYEKLYKHSVGKPRVAVSIARLYGVCPKAVRRRLALFGIGGYALVVQTGFDAARKALRSFRYDDPYPPALTDCLGGDMPKAPLRRSGVGSSLCHD